MRLPAKIKGNVLMSTPIVHGINFSTYVRSVRMALSEKGAAYTLDEVNILDGSNQSSEHLVRHPFGKIPAFSHDGITIYESSAIIRYIDRVFPGPALTPASARQAAVSDQVAGIIDSYGYGCIIGQLVWQRVVTPMLGGVPDDGVVAAGLGRVRLCVAEFARLLGDSVWFGAEHISLGDLMLAPVFTYMLGTDEGREIAGEHPALMAWFERMSARESMLETLPKFG
jgi:glutathione S-transferase